MEGQRLRWTKLYIGLRMLIEHTMNNQVRESCSIALQLKRIILDVVGLETQKNEVMKYADFLFNIK